MNVSCIIKLKCPTTIFYLELISYSFYFQSLYGGKQIDPDATAIHYLIEHGADITHQDDYGLTALHHAALRGDEVACQQLLLHATEEMPLIHVCITS